jgi:hypothetical protein
VESVKVGVAEDEEMGHIKRPDAEAPFNVIAFPFVTRVKGFSLIGGNGEDKVIVPPTKNTIRSPGAPLLASKIACRKDPAPLFDVLVTG